MGAPSSSSTLVLGSAVGLSVEQVRPFLASLREAGHGGDLGLIVDRRLARALHADPLVEGAVLLASRQLLPLSFRRIHSSRGLWIVWRSIQALAWAALALLARIPLRDDLRRRVGELIAEPVCTPMEARFLVYRRFLRTHPHSRILITDVRDVLFQSDPFRALPEHGLAASIETRRYTVASEPHNAAWVLQAYGPEMLERIGASPASCVGVTYGERRAMLTYLDLMSREIVGLPSAAARRGGADTAIHNVLLWTGRLGPVQHLETLASPVATLNGIPDDELAMSEGGRLLNRDGSEPSVVHQYDRSPSVARELLRSLAGITRAASPTE